MKIGDVVLDISSNVSMTVEKVFNAKQRVQCVWFNTESELEREMFTFNEIEIIT